jgi:hypothetical protein
MKSVKQKSIPHMNSKVLKLYLKGYSEDVTLTLLLNRYINFKNAKDRASAGFQKKKDKGHLETYIRNGMLDLSLIGIIYSNKLDWKSRFQLAARYGRLNFMNYYYHKIKEDYINYMEDPDKADKKFKQSRQVIDFTNMTGLSGFVRKSDDEQEPVKHKQKLSPIEIARNCISGTVLETAMVAAAEGGMLDIVRILIRRGMLNGLRYRSTDWRYEYCLSKACSGNSLETVEFLYNYALEKSARRHENWPTRQWPVVTNTIISNIDILNFLIIKCIDDFHGYLSGFINNSLRALITNGETLILKSNLKISKMKSVVDFTPILFLIEKARLYGVDLNKRNLTFSQSRMSGYVKLDKYLDYVKTLL